MKEKDRYEKKLANLKTQLDYAVNNAAKYQTENHKLLLQNNELQR